MNIQEAQRDVRRTFMGGFPGQLVSGLLWLTSSSVHTWWSPRAGILILLVGGTAIFPATVAMLRVMGRPPGLPRRHPMNALGRQVALALPLGLPVAVAAGVAVKGWLYPSVMILLGAHYLPFTFLYGMRMFTVLAGVLVAGGVGLGWVAVDGSGVPAGWVTGSVLVCCAFLGLRTVRLEGLTERAPDAAESPAVLDFSPPAGEP